MQGPASSCRLCDDTAGRSPGFNGLCLPLSALQPCATATRQESAKSRSRKLKPHAQLLLWLACRRIVNSVAVCTWSGTPIRDMADLTPDFSIYLKQHGAQPIVRKAYDLGKINSFLQEAYSIVCRGICHPSLWSDSLDRMHALQISRANSAPYSHLTSPPLHLHAAAKSLPATVMTEAHSR